MAIVSSTVTKYWTGANSAATHLIQVPEAQWRGHATLVAITSGGGWARVLDGRGQAFLTGSPVIGDGATMSAFTDLLVVQFASVMDGTGSARGFFMTVDDRARRRRHNIHELHVEWQSAWISIGEGGAPRVHRHIVMEGAAPLPEAELERYIERITEGERDVERLSLAADDVIAARLAQLREH